MTNDLEALRACEHVWELKDQVRTGWEIRGVDAPERVAGHAWGTAILCMLFADAAAVDRATAVEIALAHDIAEARVGDIPRRVAPDAMPVTPEAKARLERRAMDDLAPVDGPLGRLRDAWERYEERSTPEARFVRDMNLIDMCLEALRYERAGRYDEATTRAAFPDYAGMEEFFATSGPRLSTEIGRRLHRELTAEYRRLRPLPER